VGRGTYLLVPSEDSGYLMAEPGGDPQAVREVDFFVSAVPNSKGGFILHKAECRGHFRVEPAQPCPEGVSRVSWASHFPRG